MIVLAQDEINNLLQGQIIDEQLDGQNLIAAGSIAENTVRAFAEKVLIMLLKRT